MHVVKERKIGEGGFGSVYICRDKATRKKYALKEIAYKKDEGLRCLIEIYIMVKAKHQTINKSIGISFEANNLIIVQNAAMSDLKQWRNENVPDEKTIQKIMHQVVSGLDYLHYYMGIIHGDIKSGNILCFSNNSFKIADFSVSVDKGWQNRQKFLCTTTHRPPEVWMKKDIDESVDVWALGCTFHELIFNFKLFPHQSPGLTREERIRKHKELFFRSMNVIYDWASSSKQLQDLPYKKVNVEYFPMEKCDSYKDNSMNNLMFLMLSVDPKKRPTSRQILRHPFMDGKHKNPNQKCINEIKDHTKYDQILAGEKEAPISLRPHVQFLITNKSSFPAWKDIARHSYIICEKYLSSQKVELSELVHVTCFYTAYNLVFRCNITKDFIEEHFNVPFDRIIFLQKEICVALDFEFY